MSLLPYFYFYWIAVITLNDYAFWDFNLKYRSDLSGDLSFIPWEVDTCYHTHCCLDEFCDKSNGSCRDESLIFVLQAIFAVFLSRTKHRTSHSSLPMWGTKTFRQTGSKVWEMSWFLFLESRIFWIGIFFLHFLNLLF